MPSPNAHPLPDYTVDLTATDVSTEVQAMDELLLENYSNDGDDSIGDVWADENEDTTDLLHSREQMTRTSGSETHGPMSGTALTRSGEVPLPDKRLYSTHNNAGYRIGLEAARAKVAQPGFDAGYAVGGEIGMRVGELLGVILGSLAAIEDGEVRSKDESSLTDNSAGASFDVGRAHGSDGELHEAENATFDDGLKTKIQDEWFALAKRVWKKFGRVESIARDLGIDAELGPDDSASNLKAQSETENGIPKVRPTEEVVKEYTELQVLMRHMEEIMDRLGVSEPVLQA